MKALPDWIHWTVMYIGLAGLFVVSRYGAQHNDEVMMMAFPVISILRSIGIVYVAFVMSSAWYQPRAVLFTTFRMCVECVIAMALWQSGSGKAAIISALALVVYELARQRVAFSQPN
jgi:hypothetical protein